ncbi:hypothetical protein GCM10009678_50870 [Actinomadura kijaniata]|uniref:Uncharacterized protein n=1 Tax=Actinomadura namibiensis TaxID=182080 RepID=A0A7W3LHZ8_ACTNM|nr:hypothetical protein [Actinomadura namibiensis]MBA8948543.1 hypothetical protein [Actinomadura namibiensis]
MTAIVIVGDFPGTGIISKSLAPRIGETADAASSLAFLDQMTYALQQRGAVLVLHPSWRSDAAVKLVRQARFLLGTDRIARVPLDLPPLAFSVVADQMTFLAPYVRAGVLASIAPTLAMRVRAGAWLNSVAKLEHGRTGLGQHMLSYMPGSGFMVLAGMGTTVHRITSAQPVADIGHLPLDPVLVLASDQNGDRDWLQNKLGPAARATSLTLVNEQPLSTQYWGTKKYTEFVAFSGHRNDLQQVIQMTRCRPCSWCEEPTALAICAFCGCVQPGTDTAHPRPAAPATPAAPAGLANPTGHAQPAPAPGPTSAPAPPQPAVPPRPAPTPAVAPQPMAPPQGPPAPQQAPQPHPGNAPVWPPAEPARPPEAGFRPPAPAPAAPEPVPLSAPTPLSAPVPEPQPVVPPRGDPPRPAPAAPRNPQEGTRFPEAPVTRPQPAPQTSEGGNGPQPARPSLVKPSAAPARPPHQEPRPPSEPEGTEGAEPPSDPTDPPAPDSHEELRTGTIEFRAIRPR